jgi:regulator of protease activity HflC (stomatin/prohibitin superfamily)
MTGTGSLKRPVYGSVRPVLYTQLLLANDRQEASMGFEISTIILLVLAVVVASAIIKIVPQGENWTIERLGKYTRTLQSGLGILVPFIERIGRKQNMMEQVLDVAGQEVITNDNATVTTDAVCFFQISNAANASYEVNNLEYALQNLVMTNIRAVIGSMALDETLSMRDKINHQVLEKVDEATRPWGLKVTRIEIKDIKPPQDLVDAMAKQMKAEREKRATILEAEGYREAEIARAQGEKQSAVLEAEGRREAAFRDAEARERLAEAEAKATETVSIAIRNGDRQAINYFIAQKYTEAMQAIGTSSNSKVVLMPFEASSLLGSIEGIREVLKDDRG